MRSDAYAEHRAVHSHHHGRYAAPPPGELKRPTFWATLHSFAHCHVGMALALTNGWGLGWKTIAPTAAISPGFPYGTAAAWRGAWSPKSRWQPIPLRSGSCEPLSNCRRLSHLQCRNPVLLHPAMCLAGALMCQRSTPLSPGSYHRRSQRAIEQNSSLNDSLSEEFRKRFALWECRTLDCASQRQPPADRSNQEKELLTFRA